MNTYSRYKVPQYSESDHVSAIYRHPSNPRSATLPSSRHLQPTNSKLAAIYSLSPTPNFAFEDADMRLRRSKSTSNQSTSVPFLSSELL
ncbi:hypothetical protein AA0111_g12415 [Alternaria arborescens]|uniref:hypothetical protein n=1 Tax=Alternaria arborescens TaxID=156630 RepID=UPI00107556A7|nr:hypothetical protein AA0111_g12415 [Alternaria arborescens]RYO12953.1 hypothetical protein AA0111_g12415 [Alternaria arborescens]